MPEPDIPVYLFTGLLSSGKTSFIQETLEDPRFSAGERTLLLLCEEGEEEYEQKRFAAKNVFIESIEDERKINPVNLDRLVKKHDAERVLVEYNGMWMLDKLFQAMPRSWLIYQEMSFAEAGTFLMYNQNMRQLVYDKLKTCDTIVFNRYKDSIDKMDLHKIVRGASRRADIIYEFENGDIEYDDIEDPLPFDINAPIIEIADQDYAIWYRDMGENMKNYDGKTVRFKGVTGTSGALQGGFIIGREMMTCCIEDIRMAGLACLWNGPLPQTGRWVVITAKIGVQKHKVYGGKVGPVLRVLTLDPATEPEQPVATFY